MPTTGPKLRKEGRRSRLEPFGALSRYRRAVTRLANGDGPGRVRSPAAADSTNTMTRSCDVSADSK
jgi:hypothetical protein